MPALDTLRIIGSGGANRAMEAELKRLARRSLPDRALSKPRRIDTQTLLYPYDEDLAWLAVHYLRTPSRVLLDLFEIESHRLEPLYEEVRGWIESAKPRWLTDGSTISVRVPDTVSFPASGLQIRGTIKNAVIDGARRHGLKVTLEAESPAVPLVLRGQKGPMILSIDLAGRSMHARGYRLEEGEAPLKENVAAQILILARWDPRREILLDPLAGGGTFPIEAASMALAAPLWIPPVRPAAAGLPLFRARAASYDPNLPNLFPDSTPIVVGNEIHTPLFEAMKRNIERAGVGDRVLALHGDFRDLGPSRLFRDLSKRRPSAWPSAVEPDRGLLVANPPYGERMKQPRGRPSPMRAAVVDARPHAPDSEGRRGPRRGARADDLAPSRDTDLIAFYGDLRDLWRSLGGSWRAAFIVAHPEFERAFGGRPVLKKPIWNGSLRAWLLVYEP